MPFGFALPFSVATGSLGHFEMTNDELSAVRENLKSLLLTNWGERVGHYYLGCNLREYIFEPIEIGELKEKIADRILSQVSTWIPYVGIRNLNVLTSSDDSAIPENSVKLVIDFGIISKPDLSSRLVILVP